jgi:transposase InsO family protein
MTEKLKELGTDVGYRRAGRLMRENGSAVERTRKFKATTASDHTLNIAPRLCCANRMMAEVPLSPDGLIPQLP